MEFLLLDVLVLFGSTTERCYEHLFFGALCSCMYAVNMSVSHTFYSVDSFYNVSQARYRVSNNIVWYMISTRKLEIESKKGHRYFGTCILQHACELSNALCIFVESLLHIINQSYRPIYNICYTYYMANIRYHHFLISRLRTTTKSNDLERSKSTIR